MVKKLPTKNKGFTLIEMMVAVTIFSIVTLIVSGAFIVLADIYRQVQSNRAVIDNLNLAMDTMTLQIREGQEHNISPSGDEITFEEYVILNNEYTFNRILTYRLASDGSGILEQCEGSPFNEDDCTDLTSAEIVVEDLDFELQRPTSTGPAQILIVLNGVATNKKGITSRFLLQSTLSQRNIE